MKAIIVYQGKNENLLWMDRLVGEFKRHIYTRADVDMGREAGGYVHHIFKEWDNLADINIFTQADPFSHGNPDFVEKCNTIEKLMGGSQYIGLSNFRMRFDRTGSPHHPGIPVDRVHLELFGRQMPNWVNCTGNGLFAVTGAKIREKKEVLEKVRDMVWRGNPEADHPQHKRIAPECYCIERFWHLIFE